MGSFKGRYPVNSIWPISSGYGPRKDPKTRKKQWHRGYDFATPVGIPVYAIDYGDIFRAGYQDPKNRKIGFGLRIWQKIWISGYEYDVFYAHLSKILVKAGQEVEEGQLIGYTGNTGKSSGPHLHFEVRPNGKKGIPIEFIEEEKQCHLKKPSILTSLKEIFCQFLSKLRF